MARRTSKPVAKAASKLLKTSPLKKVKKVAASALSQRSER